MCIRDRPYSESERFIYWLINQKFKHATVILQKEFTDKLISAIDRDSYRSISVVSQYCLDIKPVETIPPSDFHPSPKVHSTIVVIKSQNTLTNNEISTVKKLFSFRRKQLGSILNILNSSEGLLSYYSDNMDLSKRIYEFSPDIIVSLVRHLISDSRS